MKLRQVDPQSLFLSRRNPVDAEALATSAAIVEDVRTGAAAAVRKHAERFGDLVPGAEMVRDRSQLEAAWLALPVEEKQLLQRVAARIEEFARAQAKCLLPLDFPIEGGVAGHRWLPVGTVGAYAPGGRYPLPSSVLMSAIPARIAGVESVWVASPKPTEVTMGAAFLAGADGLLACGGAQAIGALAFGTHGPAADMIVGPGNRYVTAAKKHLVGEVGIDALAGPSELVVIAGKDANAELIASDLIAQAEHDVSATVVLLAVCPDLIAAVDRALASQLQNLSTEAVARESLQRNGLVVLAGSLEQAMEISNRLAPEHLELCGEDAAKLASAVTNYGGLFLGNASAEVFGDYGAGPNHVLPTGGSSRFQAGLSVATFLRPLTYLDIKDPTVIAKDSARLARLEGLEGHARSAEQRL
ncbi:MAG: histidinol dehydrogenase [Planctomycetota bacterium]|nr:histidinol dehydrogenase [Planctomycetota bacterium]MDG2144304.1 histidinol dehydrogenase [Planctomycetota bacterium]